MAIGMPSTSRVRISRAVGSGPRRTANLSVNGTRLRIAWDCAHAVHDCEGRNPGKGEFEAVRIENIYRRAAHLCQRTRYGDAPLPPAMMRDASTCSIACVRTAVDAPAPADSASPAGDAESAR